MRRRADGRRSGHSEAARHELEAGGIDAEELLEVLLVAFGVDRGGCREDAQLVGAFGQARAAA